MANITAQNPIRYQIDTLSYTLTGVIASSSSSYADLTAASSVTGINISGNQPANSNRYFAFRVNNKWGKLTSAGAFQAFSANNTEFSNIEANGNTTAELSALTNIPGLAGQNVGVAIAMSTTDPVNSLPTCSISFSCVTDSQKLQNIQYSPVYNLGSGAQLISLSADTENIAGGNVTVQAQATLDDGTVTDWKDYNLLNGQKCKAIQFRGIYQVSSIGAASCSINNASIIYSDGSSLASGLTDGEIITQTMDWYMPIHSCRLTVNHSPLENSNISAYVAFREQPKQSRRENLGIGTGARKTFQLAHTNGIKYDSFVLYFDSSRVFTEYELNTEVGRVTCIAPEGVIVSCDYDYGWDTEEWHEMRLSSRISMGDFDRSEYRLSQPSNSKSMAAIKIKLSMTSGRISNEVLGSGTGTARSYRLTKRVLDGKISITANNSTLSTKNWKLLEDPQYISIAAAAGSTIRATYDWISETPTVFQFAAVFAE